MEKLKCFTQSEPQAALIFLDKVEKHALKNEGLSIKLMTLLTHTN